MIRWPRRAGRRRGGRRTRGGLSAVPAPRRAAVPPALRPGWPRAAHAICGGAAAATPGRVTAGAGKRPAGPPSAPAVQIRVDQVGYPLAGPKIADLMTATRSGAARRWLLYTGHGALFADGLQSYSTTEPAIDLTALSPLAFAWQEAAAGTRPPPWSAAALITRGS